MREYTDTVRSEDTYRDLFRTLTLAGALASLILLVVMVLDPGSDGDWEVFQQAFRDTLMARSTTEEDSATALSFPTEIRQISLNIDSRIDRCVTCHLGMIYPGLEDLPQPLREHSGTYLPSHSLDNFGCTLCHGGNGRQITIQTPCTATLRGGHAREALPYIESSCGRCHMAVFDTSTITGAPVLERGRAAFQAGGCLGCHRLRMVGGTLGPDLSDQGKKSLSHYDFRSVLGERSKVSWLIEHFHDPPRISPGSVMPPVGASPEEVDALVTFTLSLYPVDLPADYYGLPVLSESRGQRSSLVGMRAYNLLCNACHGRTGGGTRYESARTGAPALNGIGFQSVASDEFIRFTLMEGRGPRLMGSWQPMLSGLRTEELDSLIIALRQWKAPAREWEEVQKASGSVGEGERIFASRCSPCHGSDREGGIGPGLASNSLLSLATDRFLYSTIAIGRRNTAMPSWSHLTNQQLHSLVLFLRGNYPFSIAADDPAQSTGDSVRGGRMFESYCSRCHGAHGEGGIGPAILNPDFLAAADDAFLAGTIQRGRPHTPMFGWSQAGVRLSPADIRSIIAYLRGASARPPRWIYPGAVLGHPQRGRELFRDKCSECHGSNGEGTKGPALNNQELLNAATNGFLLATITLGRPGTAMPSWGEPSLDRHPLSQEERLDLVAFIRVWQTEVIDQTWLHRSASPPHLGDAPASSVRR